MAVWIHHAPQFNKCLDKLRRAGGRAALAVQQVEEILATLALHDRIVPEQIHKHTNHGEHRIDGCQKFDLVGGYRLIYVKEGNQYYMLFAGTHDTCDRWLNHHKRLKPAAQRATTLYIAHQTEDVSAAPSPNVPEDNGDYDGMILQHIDENMLRRIFRGLCGT